MTLGSIAFLQNPTCCGIMYQLAARDLGLLALQVDITQSRSIEEDFGHIVIMNKNGDITIQV